jgi:Dyp-type peroxidase family
MGSGPVTAPAQPPPSWRIRSPEDAQTQGLVVSGFAHLPWAEALFLRLDALGGAWLRALQGSITDATGKPDQAAAIAFTCTGLAKLGLEEETLATFSAPFQEGMYEENRLRRLGDRADGKWLPTVTEGGPLWSGNRPAKPDEAAPPAAVAAVPAQTVKTPKTVHALVLLYDSDAQAVNQRASQLSQQLARQNVVTVHQLALDLRFDPKNPDIAREHFGFADGLSQPIPYGDAIVLSTGAPAPQDPWHGVPAGEILIGHMNAHHEPAPGPMVKASGEARQAGLLPDGAPEGFLNFGINGSYMVVRQLQQNVASFWNSLEAAAKIIKAEDPSAGSVTAQWLAERVFGRTIDGDLLVPGGTLPPKYGEPDNDFGFIKTDPQGLGCPFGSHMRRANPRDGLAKDEASAQTLLNAANSHRILRRGRKYGATIADPRTDDKVDRGLLFVCFNTDLVRQFEFVQQTWLLNPNFATLFDEVDPLVGPKGPFTIPSSPLRRIVELDTFVKMAGGEYFFLPSIPALNYLATLPGPSDLATP